MCGCLSKDQIFAVQELHDITCLDLIILGDKGIAAAVSAAIIQCEGMLPVGGSEERGSCGT